ncbi:NHL repeat-containing protein [Nocardioides salsibiostraticola]
MRVQILTTGSTHSGVVPGFGRPDTEESPPTTYGGWRPRAVLGAESPGGLLLPPAMPTAAHMYAPRAVWTDGERIICADTGNHRVLIWNQVPTTSGVSADVVLGQTDSHSEGPAAGGVGPANGMNLPTGVLLHEGRLLVADAWHHRILIWDTLPSQTGTPPDHVLGQPDLESTEPNAGGEPDATTFYWPFGIAIIDGRFHVTDTGNRRVLIWFCPIPEPGQPADVVLGQPDERGREENRGVGVGADSFRWPHAVTATGSGGLWVADAGNHRLLRWDVAPLGDGPADAVLGQDDFSGSMEFPYISQAGRLRFPYAVCSVPGSLAVADTANNRVLIYEVGGDNLDVIHDRTPDVVLGQPTAAANGENRWESVAGDTLCWPYGLAWHQGQDSEIIAIADSGNNRIVLWERA